MSLLLLLACALPGALNDTDAPAGASADADTGADTAPNTAPEVDGLAMRYEALEIGGGVQEPGGMPQVATRFDWWLIDGQLSDAEGDLRKYTLRFWLEPDGDGLVSGPALAEDERGTDDPSPVYAADIGTTFSLSEDRHPRFGVTYDVGIQVIDARGAESEIAVVTATAPPAP